MTVEEYVALLRENPNEYEQTFTTLFDPMTTKVCAIGLLFTEQYGSFKIWDTPTATTMWIPDTGKYKEASYLYATNYLEKPSTIEDDDWDPGFLELIIHCNDVLKLSFSEIADAIEKWIGDYQEIPDQGA